MTHRKSNVCSIDMAGSNVYKDSFILTGVQSLLRMSIAPLVNNSWLKVPFPSTHSNDLEMSDSSVRSVKLARVMGR